ncbi:RNF168 (predicted) [Pycnogonum litorale]
MAGISTRKENMKTKKNDVKLCDVMCPICLCILMEPVTLACGHELCMQCLEEHVQKISFTCPFCRIRIGNWMRKTKKENSLVNVKRWNQIRRLFPKEVEDRLCGNDSCINDDEFPSLLKPKLCTPGSIRREYEEQLREYEQMQAKKHEEEDQASRAYISTLMEEEDVETDELQSTEQNDNVVYKRNSSGKIVEPSTKRPRLSLNRLQKQEEEDTLLARKQQKRFDLEARLRKETIRSKYRLRHRKQKTSRKLPDRLCRTTRC